MEREDVGYCPFAKPNSAIALESGLLGNPAHTGITMDIDVASIGMAGFFDQVRVAEAFGCLYAIKQDRSGKHCLVSTLLKEI